MLLFNAFVVPALLLKHGICMHLLSLASGIWCISTLHPTQPFCDWGEHHFNLARQAFACHFATLLFPNAWRWKDYTPITCFCVAPRLPVGMSLWVSGAFALRSL